MPDVGFLARYSERPRVDLGDGYWLTHRKFLSRSDFAAANDKLFSPIVRITAAQNDDEDATSETSGALNTSAQQDEYVARALVDWNLTDESNQLIPLGKVDPETGPDATRYAAVRILPEDVFDQVLAGISGVNPTRGRKAKEAAAREKAASDRFPVEAGAPTEARPARTR